MPFQDIDQAGMFAHLAGFPEQWRHGRSRALAADLDGLSPVEAPVLVVGMGGSAMGGDLLRSLALQEASVPVLVSRGYRLPAWVGEGDTVVISSYSGRTEETLSAMHEAMARRASLVCITSGGAVGEVAQEHGLPVVNIPDGMPPRAALGWSFTALLTIAERLALIRPNPAAWEETQHMLDVQTAVLATPTGNEALTLAESLHGLRPFVYSSEGLMEGVNLRWRNQMHENAKVLATGNVFPELNHNEIMGWEWASGDAGRVGVVVLRDVGDHPQVTRRMDVTRGLLCRRAGRWTEVTSRGSSALCRVVSLVSLGDWVSYYLAVQQGVDPTPIGLIDLLKAALQDQV